LIQKEITILNRLGLHARPAAQFVKIAAQYKADVFLVRNAMRINAKRIMGVMMLAAEKGSKLTLECIGEDEAELCTALINLIESKFNEE
jgi:phosphocarrier protein HPr